MTNSLEELESMTTIVVDTADIDSIKAYKPTDATTNPSLVFQAAQKSTYKNLIEDAVNYAKGLSLPKEDFLPLLMDKLLVNFGTSFLKIIPGRVSTEVDARLSFDIEGSIKKAKQFIKLYADQGISKERVLIKLASTWEGSRAAIELEKEGIHCNMTLMFSLAQAVICAEAKATLVSPFVGRILDWYKKAEGKESYPPAEDPGVKSVTEIYHYYKKFGINTKVMGASFRNKEEILELAGCDLLTISPQLLGELKSSSEKVIRKLDPKNASKMDIKRLDLDEKDFRWLLNENQMATEKLSEGIRKFNEDYQKLEKYIVNTYSL